MTATTHLTLAVSCLLVTAVSFNSPARADASLESECQSEAVLYEIPEEQRADYVAGCLASRGGSVAMDPVEEELSQETAEDTESEAGEPPLETDQQ